MTDTTQALREAFNPLAYCIDNPSAWPDGFSQRMSDLIAETGDAILAAADTAQAAVSDSMVQTFEGAFNNCVGARHRERLRIALTAALAQQAAPHWGNVPGLDSDEEDAILAATEAAQVAVSDRYVDDVHCALHDMGHTISRSDVCAAIAQQAGK